MKKCQLQISKLHAPLKRSGDMQIFLVLNNIDNILTCHINYEYNKLYIFKIFSPLNIELHLFKSVLAVRNGTTFSFIVKKRKTKKKSNQSNINCNLKPYMASVTF